MCWNNISLGEFINRGAGAGQIGNYDCCAWQTKGTGQYRPLDNSQPYQGERNRISVEGEYKVELVCETSKLKQVLQTLVKTHPYETPAYEAYPIVTLNDDNLPK